MEIGEYIKTIRLERKYSQRKLAMMCDLSNTTISRIESNTVTPDMDSLSKLATALKVPIEQLINFTEYEQIIQKETPEIIDKLEQLKKELETEDTLMFDGAPATAEQVEAILNALEMGKAYATQKAKEKFTRKDYRK